MKRICILGNSHLSAFKQAIDDGPIDGVSTQFAFDTFGSVRESLKHVRIKGQRVIAGRKDVKQAFVRTGGAAEIDLAQYDGLILTFRNSPYYVRPYLCGGDIAPLSQPVVDAVHAGFLQDWSVTLAAKLARAMRGGPVWFLGRPFNAANDFHARKTLRQLEDAQHGAAAQARMRALQAQITEAVSRVPVAENLQFVPPPAHLLEPYGLFTKTEYSRGGKKLGAKMRSADLADQTQDEDTIHMNGAYAAQMLRTVLSP